MIAMKSETPAQRYRGEADKCRQAAEKATNVADQKAWLWLANDWTKLAQWAEQVRPARPSNSDLILAPLWQGRHLDPG